MALRWKVLAFTELPLRVKVMVVESATHGKVGACSSYTVPTDGSAAAGNVGGSLDAGCRRRLEARSVAGKCQGRQALARRMVPRLQVTLARQRLSQVCSEVFEGSDGTIGAERRFGHDQEMHTATAGGMRFLVAWKQVHKVARKTLACRHYQESQEEAARQKGKRRKFSRTLVSSAEVDSELC